MYVVFDLNDEKNKKRTEYEMKDVSFVPRIGETIELSNGIRVGCLHGRFKIYDVAYIAFQSKLEEDLKTGEGGVKEVRIYAKKV